VPSRRIETRGEEAEGPTYITAERRALCVCVAAASTGRSIGVEQQTGHSKHSLSGVFFIHNNHFIRAGRVLQSFGDPEHRASGRASTSPTHTSSV
jgi:hypothetical protein